MNDYIEVRVNLNPCSSDMTDVVAALLADAGFESFVPDDSGLSAYIRSNLYDDSMQQILDDIPFDCSATWVAQVIEGRDWNQEWERNYFQPIVVADRCVIHSSFHTDIPKCEYDITVDPKMAFGTGHHSTTWLMISRLLETSLDGKSVIDMGTGTGILAILAAMRGATLVVGIEIDECAYDNAIDNVRLNNHPEIRLIHGCAYNLSEIDFKADLLLANINRNVILDDLNRYVDALAPGGEIFLSGFYTADVPMIEAEAQRYGLKVDSVIDRLDWACVRLVRLKNNH